MSALILLRCNCADRCPARKEVPAQTHADARMYAERDGWTSDYLGDVVDYAPGHQQLAVAS